MTNEFYERCEACKNSSEDYCRVCISNARKKIQKLKAKNADIKEETTDDSEY